MILIPIKYKSFCNLVYARKFKLQIIENVTLFNKIVLLISAYTFFARKLNKFWGWELRRFIKNFCLSFSSRSLQKMVLSWINWRPIILIRNYSILSTWWKRVPDLTRRAWSEKSSYNISSIPDTTRAQASEPQNKARYPKFDQHWSFI